jgi:glyoxylase-like metal-dependent hydrolase (beta-lactamase superfamily II)
MADEEKNAKYLMILKGNIGILTAEGDLFAGDTFVNRKRPDSAEIIENLQELENSIDLLKKMNIKMVYPGHGRPFMMKRFPHSLT